MIMRQISSATHEAIYRVEDAASGLTGFIAIHSTQLGPAAGGLAGMGEVDWFAGQVRHETRCWRRGCLLH